MGTNSMMWVVALMAVAVGCGEPIPGDSDGGLGGGGGGGGVGGMGSGGGGGGGSTVVSAVSKGSLKQLNATPSAAADKAVGSAAVSPDGTVVAFWSCVTNLVPGVTNGAWHLYARAIGSDLVAVLDTAEDGTVSNDTASSDSPRAVAFSPDGNFILFSSSGTNLVTSPDVGNLGGWGPYLFSKSLATGAVGFIAKGAVTAATWSPDGKMIAFTTDYPLYAPDPNNASDVFVWTIGAPDGPNGHPFVMVSANAAGTHSPVWSPDSKQLAFVSESGEVVPGDNNGAGDVFVKTVATGAITRISTSSSGGELNGASTSPAWSPDGTRIAFDSRGDNGVPGDGNSGPSIFVKTLGTGALALVSVRADGRQPLFGHKSPKWSFDGKQLSFASEGVEFLDTAADGNLRDDLYVKDLVTGAVTLMSATAAGVIGNGLTSQYELQGSTGGWLPNGAGVVFVSRSTNFASDGNAFEKDLFLKSF